MGLDALHRVLTSVKAVGDDGFEGLVAIALNAASDIRFRLSKSGQQDGTDGDSNSPGDWVGFECKRYSDPVPMDSVKAKLLDLQARQDVDLWVLAATVGVAAQDARALREHGARVGLEVQIVDWTESGTPPPLAVLVSRVDPDGLDQFLRAANVSPKDRKAARRELDALRHSATYAPAVDDLIRQLDLPTLGFESARRANEQWLCEVLASPAQARRALGQPLSPLAMPGPHRIRRTELITAIQNHMTGTGAPTTLALLGVEGVGKSWAPVDAWLELPSRPMLIFVPAGQLAHADGQTGLVDVLPKLFARRFRSTGPVGTTGERWERMVTRWLMGPPYRTRRIVVIIDGVNQHQNAEWGRAIGNMASELSLIGGRLIVSCRTAFYTNMVQRRMPERAVTLEVGGWTLAERDEILRHRGLSADGLSPSVGEVLRNPRMLTVTLELFDDATLRQLHELTLPLLMFEHLRISERDAEKQPDTAEFLGRLKDKAQKLLDATSNEDLKGLLVFGDLEATAEGQFFHPDPKDARRYHLSGEGRMLALGLALLERVQDAVDAGKDPGDIIAKLIEPISALDDTAQVVLAAAHAAHLWPDDEGENAMVALLCAFVRLQNVDADYASSFNALARRRPAPFLAAVESIWLMADVPDNAEWLVSAVCSIATGTPEWELVIHSVKRWLRLYRPGVAAVHDRPQDAQWVAHIKSRSERLSIRESHLTFAEKAILGRLTHAGGMIEKLVGLTFRLLAGRPLAPVIPALADWAFSSSLSQEPGSPENEFVWLGNHNRVDWQATREALQSAVRPLEGAPLSRTGRNAQVKLLRFSGAADDGQAADVLVEALLSEHPHRELLQRQDDQTTLEAGDPEAVEPDDVDAHVEAVAATDVGGIYTNRSTTKEDQAFEAHLPHVVRFRPDIAVRKAREFAEAVPTRKGLPLRQGIYGLRKMGLVVNAKLAHTLVDLRTELAEDHARELTEDDRSLVGSLLLISALPYLDGDAQVTALARAAPDTNVWLQLIDSYLDASVSGVDEAVGRIRACPRALRFVSSHIAYTDTPLTASVHDAVDAMLASKSQEDRVSALVLLAERANGERLCRFLDTGWSANGEVGKTEAYFGSLVLVRAVNVGAVSAATVVGRIVPEAYGALAEVSGEGAWAVGECVDSFLRRASGLDIPHPPVDLTLHILRGKRVRDLLDIDQHDDGLGFPPRFIWSDEDYRRNSERNHATFKAFLDEANDKQANLAVKEMRPHQFEAVIGASASHVPQWCAMLHAMPEAARPAVANLALKLSAYLAPSDPARAIGLYRLYAAVPPYVALVFDMGQFTLAQSVAWSAPESALFRELRREGIARADNDQQLATDVLAAEARGRTTELLSIVDELLASLHPADQARALTILGFMDESDAVRTRLYGTTVSSGLAGSARNAAIIAYRSNAWARHWFVCMLDAATDAEAWPFAVLVWHYADARYDGWQDALSASSANHRRLLSGIRENVQHRAAKLGNKRRKTLFGMPCPDEIYLAGRTG